MGTRMKFLSRSALAAACLLLMAPAQTVAPAPLGDDVPRSSTLILHMDSGRDLTPDVWNPFLPTSRQMSQGFHQRVLEPLFILNYETGQVQGWQGESMTPNGSLVPWTLKIGAGVAWRDGVRLIAH